MTDPIALNRQVNSTVMAVVKAKVELGRIHHEVTNAVPDLLVTNPEISRHLAELNRKAQELKEGYDALHKLVRVGEQCLMLEEVSHG